MTAKTEIKFHLWTWIMREHKNILDLSFYDNENEQSPIVYIQNYATFLVVETETLGLQTL